MGLLVENWIWSVEPLSERGFLRLEQLAYRSEVESSSVGGFYVYRFKSLINPIEEIGAYIEDEVYGVFSREEKVEIMRNPRFSNQWIPVAEFEFLVKKGESEFLEVCRERIEEDRRGGQFI